MADPTCKRCGLPIRKIGTAMRRSRRYHVTCRPRKAQESNRKPHARSAPLKYGAVFEANAAVIREKDGRKCVQCSKPAAVVDHIIPLRLVAAWARDYGDDPHALENLWTLCCSCSGIKTWIDQRAKQADFLGFAGAMSAFCGEGEGMRQRFISACAKYNVASLWKN